MPRQLSMTYCLAVTVLTAETLSKLLRRIWQSSTLRKAETLAGVIEDRGS